MITFIICNPFILTMKNPQETVLDIWKSHTNYLGRKSVGLQTINIADYMANLFCPGPFFYYIIDSPTLTLDFASQSMKTILGIDPAKFSLQQFVNYIHPDDVPFFMRCEDVVAHFLKNCIPPEQMVNYKINYCLREKTQSGTYKLFLLQTITMQTTPDGALLKVFGAHSDISHITTVNNRKLSLIGLNGEPSYFDIDVFDDTVFDDFEPYLFTVENSTFTKRELEVIKLLAKGLSTKDISKKLFISPKTVLTHRKNVLKKSGLKNTTEVVADCIRKGYI